MRRKLAKKPEIAEKIVPKDYAVGCRRPTPGNGYLEALCEDNMSLVSDTITGSLQRVSRLPMASSTRSM